MHHLLGIPVSQIPTLSHLSHGDLREVLLVNVHTSVHAYGEQSNSPRVGQVLVSNQSQMPHLSPYIVQEGVMGQNIDRRISLAFSCMYEVTARHLLAKR